ncbi:MAG: Rrf2 family transcriptional regulator [candidate division KSB1 bacterium]|nr:Rrf2 family transcriptional regulator [candidate division KSB1 bacterium]MDZ7274261.1 Rrf2 family transcriptional regulator [candidate division KSB1 bacterium]MDZ7287217.1 Rrf2 family transcriptional regulator [candidate division KSB1 bacterium]MDZ7296858.1 Rrf2 family transcriptional regulator [candidate division KSB1 bacterium]MDZ7306037.1 Rrf2 family transcriptional regulator [candidate division KSB1 bacterium]
MLHLTMTGEYAVRAMLHLASQPLGAVIPIREISRAWDIPGTFLRKIVQLLTKAGLLLSQRGISGGVSLAKPAEQISLLEVIEAAEGRMVLNTCLLQPGACPRDRWCAVHLVWQEAQRSVEKVLRAYSLAGLAELSLAKRQQRGFPILSVGRRTPAEIVM